MALCKYPLALWTDLAGHTTACTIDAVSAYAVGVDDTDAIDQIKKFLLWKYKKTPYEVQPDFLDPQIGEATVALRAQNDSSAGRFPSETTVRIAFPFVWGKRKDRSVVCCLPTLRRSFNCTKEASVKQLVEDEIKKHFAESSTTEIAQTLSPSEIRTATINVRVPAEKFSEHEHSFSALPEIAIALGDRESRRQFSPAWGRTELVNTLKNELQKKRTNVLLVGETGIGKTTVLAESVRQIRKQELQQAKENGERTPQANRFWLTSASRMIAGMSYLGQWEERAEAVIDELSEVRGVLCVENLLALMQTGSREPSASLAGFFRYFMLNNELRLVAECTKTELEVVRRLLPGFDSMFQIIHITPMSDQRAKQTLASIGEHFNQKKTIEIQPRAITQTYHLFQRFMPYDHFPGKCALFWKKQLQDAIDADQKLLDVDQIISAFVNYTGLPEFLVRDEIPLSIEEVERQFQAKIIGQPKACRAAAQIVLSFKAAMNDPHRPIGVQLFCGPTGVGKTELAKTLSSYLFGASKSKKSILGDNDRRSANNGKSDVRLLRLDMSEYGSPGAAEKLLMDSSGQPSVLVQKIRQAPFVVLLLDEIEKAHPEVFDALMTMFDEGRMVDRLGREANFCSAVIVLTSNLGTSGKDPIGFESSNQSGYEREVRKFFRPEFFNRLDKVITFDHLSQDSILKIAEIEIQELRKREGLASRNIRLHCSPEVLKYMAELGYDRRLGARPLQRTIEMKVVSPLARWMVANPSIENIKLTLERDGESITLKVDR